MKAITLTQPWASLVAQGVKMVETRSWQTSYRGPIAIHAAKGWSASDRAFTAKLIRGKTLSVPLEMTWPAPVNCHDEVLPLGKVIATAVLSAILPTSIARHMKAFESEFSYGDYSEGRFAWLLSNVQPLAKPEPAKGALGIWEWKQ